MCVSCDPLSKYRIFLKATWKDWSLSWRRTVFTVRYELNSYIQRDSKRWTQAAYLLKLVIPATTNALPRWRLNVETKTKRTLHSSHRLSFNELTNTNKILCCIVAILLSTDATARLCSMRAL